MPFVHRLSERVGDAGAYADQFRLLDAELGRDLVGRTEADAADVAGQAIGVLRNELNVRKNTACPSEELDPASTSNSMNGPPDRGKISVRRTFVEVPVPAG